MNKKSIVAALAGNPNSGKTTLFNKLTGARQHVGNWPGVTVEKKEGTCKYNGYDINVVDLPGVYSLSAYSPDEVVARKFIIEEKPDIVVNIVDASNLERNLYLTVQLIEMEIPMVVVFNMMDQVKAKGIDIDIDSISRKLEVPIVPLVASRGVGVDKVLQEMVKMNGSMKTIPVGKVRYSRDVEKIISNLEGALSVSEIPDGYSPRWLAIKLLEGDEELLEKFGEVANV